MDEITRYGVWAVIVYNSLRFILDVLPPILNKVVPHKLKQDEQRFAVERAEIEWRHKLEERMVVAVETLSDKTQQILLSNALTNERLNTHATMLTALQNMLIEHDRFTQRTAEVQNIPKGESSD